MFSLPYSMFQLLMDVETLLLTPTTPQLRIWTAKLYPLTLFYSFSPNLDFFVMGRCCSLFTRFTYRNPWPTAPTATILPYTYSTPYPMLAFICNIYIITTTDMFFCSSPLYPCNSNPTVQCIPTKLVLFVSCIYHRMSVYILCTPTKCRICTTPVVSHPLLLSNPL